MPPKVARPSAMISRAVRMALLLWPCWDSAQGATLPVPCLGGACGAAGFVSAGQATASQSGTKLTINQTSTNATLNWQSFNISADGTVQYVQPSSTSIALNKIFQGSPSQIFGALNSNGRVFLINQNGILFGSGAQVNVGGLVASSLNINPTAATNGLIAPGSNGQAAFQAFSGSSGDITIQSGATLQTGNGGQILIFAPQLVSNQGTITTPGGQTILAAGNAIYLASSSNSDLRGLLVEVGGTGGTVTNGAASNSSVSVPQQLLGQIAATDGNVTLAGLAVNQLGRVSATTSINENGSIVLQAGDHGLIQASGAVGVSGTLSAGNGGQLVLGQQSLTDVTLDGSDPATTVDSVPQPKSSITMTGDSIQMLSGSVARATSGEINVTAALSGTEPLSSQSDGSRFYVAPGAELDVSGATVVLPVSSNVIPVKLEGTELANSPLQQNGPLMGQTVYVDIRQGTPLADISGAIADIGRNVLERNLTGGTINVQSYGDVIFAPGSQLNLAGGQIQYTPGYLDTTELTTTTGQVVNIGSANPNVLYTGIANTATSSNPKWGVTSTYTTLAGTYEQGYVEGKDAGSVSIIAPQFILDGGVNASTVTGMFQRQPDQPVPSGSLYRSYDEVPQAASLSIGAAAGPGGEAVASNVSVETGLQLPDLMNADGTTFDPLTDALPASYTTSVLRPQLLGPQGFGNVSLHLDGTFTQASDTALDFPAGGSFSVYANVIDFEGSMSIPGGRITAVAQPTVNQEPSGYALTLGPQADLTTAGEWVNDNPVLYPNGNLAPLYINGGTVSLTAESDNASYGPGVQIAAGSVIDVSGGAQLTDTRALNAGSGGNIVIGAQILPSSQQPAQTPPRLVVDGTLRGYGLLNGGSLSLSDGAVCVAASDCSGGDPSVLWVSPAQLQSGGFASFSLNADYAGLSVAPATSIALEQQNLVLTAGFQSSGDASSLSGLSQIATLPDQQRQPVSLNLSQNIPGNTLQGASNSLTLEVADDTPDLSIGAGAVIQTDPLGAITLSSNIRILDDGTLRAPGGNISLNLGAGLGEQQYNYSQAIWLGSQAVLDASGTTQIFPNSLGQPKGSVLPGGTVSLAAQRGFLELLPGSVVDVAGSSGIVDVSAIGSAQVHPEQIASAGGAVNLTAADGMELGAQFQAAAGTAGAGTEQPAGGSFSLTLNGNSRNDFALGFQGGSTFPNGPRQIIISATQPPVVVAPGSEVPAWLAGNAYVSSAQLQQAGFDSLAFQAVPLSTSGTTAVPGSINFVGNVALSAGLAVSLDSASYTVSPGAIAQVHAPYVQFGNSDQYFTAETSAVLAATGGSGELDVTGNFIELFGTTTLQGIGSAQFDSSGDLQLRGVLNLSGTTLATAYTGALNAAGDVELAAQQVYPTTLTQFLISADPASASNPTTGSITLAGAPGSNTDLLSAGGAVTLSAGTVTQNGVLRAPFGDIVIDAQTVQLGAGSLTSTSANGLTVPFGTTQGGLEWVYPLPNRSSLIYGTAGLSPPAQQITLNGAQVNVQSGAVIDVSGGGDLQAYEWIDGTGGTNDVLSNLATQGGRPNQYAIVPALSANIAPYDPNIWSGSNLTLGESVYLSGVPGLPAGVYQLLPSRYALLPGAYLVTQVPGYQDIQSGQSFPVLGGGTIVSGYFTTAGTSFGNSRTSGFDVVPASIVLQQAQYTTTSANQFFAAQAPAANTALPRLPEDAGVLSLIASDTLTLDGTLRTAGADGGLGAAVDVASADILVTNGTGTPTQPGQIVLSATSLDALGAQTLLLGGLQQGASISTSAQNIELAAGANLDAPEVLLSAQNQVTLDNGASITATGSAPPASTFLLSGDGAFLGVSAGPQNTLMRNNVAGATGTLTLASGSTVTAGTGSIYLDATQNVVTAGNLAIAGGNLALQAPVINVGAPPPGTSGATLGEHVLGSGLSNLLLESATGINFYGTVSVSADNVTLDTGGFNGFGAASDTASFNAGGTLKLQNSQGVPTPDPGSGTGSLSLGGADVIFGGGTLSASGFSSLSLDSQQTLTTTASGGLDVFSAAGTPGTSLTVTASRITAASDTELTLTTPGAVLLSAPTAVAMLPADAQLGGSVQVSGSSINVATSIVLPSGSVTLTTTGAGGTTGTLSLASNAVIDLGAVVQNYDGVPVASPGGALNLNSAGDINLAAGSAVDVSSPSGGAGSVALSAPDGQVTLAGALAGQGAAGGGGSFSLDGQSFGSFAALNQTLAAGGFTGNLAIRQRGPGDLVIAAGTGNAVTAHDVTLEADQGRILVDGLIDASGSQGGTVTLAAASDVVLAGAIDARATSAGGSGGSVSLETAAGAMVFNSGATINVAGGGESGTVLFRVPQTTVANALAGSGGVTLDGTVTGSSRSTLEAFSDYQNTTGVISAADEANIQGDVSAFMNSVTPAGTAQLGSLASTAAFQLEPGVEIDATVASNGTGNLTLPRNAPWNLYDWRFGSTQVPGILTLRAQGSVTFQSSLSDGFAATSGTSAFTLPSTPSDSWSYRIVAGSDFGAANPLTVDAAKPADVTLVGGSGTPSLSTYKPTMVRTGDGFIDVSASGNFVLGNQSAMLYTAGVANTQGIPLSTSTAPGTLRGMAYPTDGGNIDINVSGNVIGAATNQFVNPWLWRVGASNTSPNSLATAWTVSFQNFQQDVGALGGGDVTIAAGGDITNFSASIPSIGLQIGGKTQSTSIVDVEGGGQLTVTAGGSILGGSYYVGQGNLTLEAGGSIGAVATSGTPTPAPIIGLGNTSLVAQAGGQLTLADIVDPFLLNRGTAQGAGPTSPNIYFSTYGSSSAVSLTSVAGNVVLDDEYSAVSNAIGSSYTGNTPLAPNLEGSSAPFDVLPPTLNVYALSGDIDIGRIIALAPSPTGNLQLFANQNIVATSGISGSAGQLIVSDVAQNLLPTPAAPALASQLQIYVDMTNAVQTSAAPPPDEYAATPVHLGEDQSGQLAPVRVVALNGSIDFQPSSEGNNGIWSAKPVVVYAGQDIVDLNLTAENLGAADVTSVTAGRDTTYPQQYAADGTLLSDTNGIFVDGPGALQVTAGRNVDLGTSSGIVTRGNLLNPALSSSGADVSVEAGIGAGAPQYATFISTYVTGADTYDAELVAFVQGVEAVNGLTPTQAKQQFAAMSPQLQRAFVEELYFELLRQYGSQEAASGNGDFSGAFAAIQTLFPGANPDLKQGQANPYGGDINLYFSQIYTEQGANISLLAPGGAIDVGLAAAPSSFGISKLPDQLGIVAETTGNVNIFDYGNFLVDQSRVFAADGGQILVWSTEGNIDAGAGAKTSISAPTVNILYDSNGQPTVTLRSAIAGSGIQALTATPGISPGSVYLFAPHGVVNANQAGIVAGNLTVAATAVLGTSNISVSGTTVGVPVAVTGLGASFAGAASTAGATANAAENLGGENSSATSSKTPAADAALSFLDVFVTGLGAANCKPEDVECLKRDAARPAAH